MRSFCWSLGGLALLALAAPAPAGEEAGPVPELAGLLREAPSRPLGKEALAARRKKLEAAVARLTNPADLCRAAVLLEWRPRAVGPPGADEALAQMRARVRQELGRRLVKACREALGKEESAQAMLTLVARSAQEEQELLAGPELVRAAHKAIFPELAPDVQKLAEKGRTQPIRSAALRALVHLGLSPAEQARHLQAGLEAKDLAERRVAARLLKERLEPPFRPHVPPEDPGPLATALLPVAGKGLDADDTTVRQLCLEAVAVGSHELVDLVRQHTDVFSGEPSPLASEDPRERAEEVARLKEELAPTLAAFAQLDRLLPAVRKHSSDADTACCLAAVRVLEEAASARLLLGELSAALPAGERKEVCKAVVEAVPAVAQLLKHREVTVRVEAVAVLETLAKEAAPASGELAEALTKDANKFVRWGSARALRNMAPSGAEKGVPALARALADDDFQVRSTAASALARSGSAARPAVKALGEAVRGKDGKLRLLALRTLAALGKDAQPAEATLAAALGDDSPEVRAAAARALARIGKLDKKTRAALTKALDDPDPNVREEAAAALLAGT